MIISFKSLELAYGLFRYLLKYVMFLPLLEGREE